MKVDLNIFPWKSPGWEVKKHVSGGVIETDNMRVALKPFGGHTGDQVCNGNMAELYSTKPALIPEEFSGKTVVFLGTEFTGPSGDSYFRFIEKDSQGGIHQGWIHKDLLGRRHYVAVFG